MVPQPHREQAASYRVRWYEDAIQHHRFVQLNALNTVSGRGDPCFPPGIDIYASGEMLIDAHCSIILGERGSGMSAVLDFVRHGWTSPEWEASAISIRSQGRNVQAGLLPWSALLQSPVGQHWAKQLRDATPDQVIPEIVRNLETVDQVDAGKGRQLVAIRGIDLLDPRAAERTIGRIRGALEFERYPSGLRILLLGRDEYTFTTGPFSHLLDVCDVYRTPHLRTSELAGTDEHVVGPAGAAFTLHKSVAEACVTWTGGQPALVNTFLRRLELALGEGESPSGVGSEPGARLRLGEAVDQVVIDTVGYELQERAPHEVRAWREGLARILIQEPRLRGFTRGLVMGDKHAKVGAEHQPLFVGGWLYRDPSQDEPGWQMSRCHRKWARDVLSRPEQFIDRTRR